MKNTRLRYGMAGGASGAFIGAVHRTALEFDKQTVLAAGCFSSNPEKNAETGEALELSKERIYSSYTEMAARESERPDGIHFVTIVTPNNTHYAIAKAFLDHGIHVMCEKPLCATVAQAEELAALAREKNLLFGVMYSYSGYTMVKQARELVASGAIGRIINVNAEFLQEWLIDDVSESEDNMVKLSAWRKDPTISGISNCVGDLCTHVEHTVSYITGLSLKRVAAKLDTFGQPLDLNANILVEFENGAHGVFCSSQVCAGHMNGLVVRIFGSEGAVEWIQEQPDVLYVTKKGQPMEVYNRGMGYITGRAASLSRLPSGHPEGLHVGVANTYQAFVGAVASRVRGEVVSADEFDFPQLKDGVAGVRFVHACVESSARDAGWVSLEELK